MRPLAPPVYRVTEMIVNSRLITRPNDIAVSRVPRTLGAVRRLNLHEYQSAQLMAEKGVNVPMGIAAKSVAEAVAAAAKIGDDEVVIKSQILAGGRGLGTFTNGFQGGVHVIKTSEVAEYAGKMLGGTLVTIAGDAFDAFDGDALTLRCRFGSRAVPGVSGSLTRNSTLCYSPPHLTRQWNSSGAGGAVAQPDNAGAKGSGGTAVASTPSVSVLQRRHLG